MFNFRVNNFRSFNDSQLSFSKINILIGENSSGKSSILKFLLAIKQSLLNPQDASFLLNGNYVELGNYDAVVFNHDSKRKLHFGLDIVVSQQNLAFLAQIISEYYPRADKNKIKKMMRRYNSKNFSFDVIFQKKNNRISLTFTKISHPDIGSLTIKRNLNSKKVYNTECNVKFHDQQTKAQYAFRNVEYSSESFLSLIIPSSLAHQITEHKIRNKTEFFLRIGLLLIAQNELRSIFSKIIYVNPIQSRPERIYHMNDRLNSYSRNDLEKLMNVLSSENVNNNNLILELNRELKSNKIAEGIKLVRSEEVSVIELRIKKNGLWHNITDVGYGISLQIPLLFETIAGDKNNGKIILIEQPEVHLHPDMQCDLISALMGLSKKNRFIIETHSEHILRKLQVIVKKGMYGIKPEDVSIYYFRRNNKKTILSSHKIQKNGLLSQELPPGFYDKSYSLIEELLGV